MALRLDKWLWAARFFKTRSQASDAIKSGKVDMEGRSVKSSQAVRVGDLIVVRKGAFRFHIEVNALADKRGNAESAKELYTESDESIRTREEIQNRLKADRAMAPKGIVGGRPTKKQRRDLMALKESYLSSKVASGHED